MSVQFNGVSGGVGVMLGEDGLPLTDSLDALLEPKRSEEVDPSRPPNPHTPHEGDAVGGFAASRRDLPPLAVLVSSFAPAPGPGCLAPRPSRRNWGEYWAERAAERKEEGDGTHREPRGLAKAAAATSIAMEALGSVPKSRG